MNNCYLIYTCIKNIINCKSHIQLQISFYPAKSFWNHHHNNKSICLSHRLLYHRERHFTFPSSGIRAQNIHDRFEAIYCFVNCQNFFVQRVRKELIMIILPSTHLRLHYVTSEYIIPYLSPRFRTPKFVYMSHFIVQIFHVALSASMEGKKILLCYIEWYLGLRHWHRSFMTGVRCDVVIHANDFDLYLLGGIRNT
jgi:hypothetical protein